MNDKPKNHSKLLWLALILVATTSGVLLSQEDIRRQMLDGWRPESKAAVTDRALTTPVELRLNSVSSPVPLQTTTQISPESALQPAQLKNPSVTLPAIVSTQVAKGSSLRRAIEQEFDAKQKLQEAQVQVLQSRIAELKKILSQRQANRQAIIEKRLADLAGDTAQPSGKSAENLFFSNTNPTKQPLTTSKLTAPSAAATIANAMGVQMGGLTTPIDPSDPAAMDSIYELRNKKQNLTQDNATSLDPDEPQFSLSVYRVHSISTDLAYEIVMMMLRDEKGIRLAKDSKSGGLVLYGQEKHHQLVADILKRLMDEVDLSQPLNADEPIGGTTSSLNLPRLPEFGGSEDQSLNEPPEQEQRLLISMKFRRLAPLMFEVAKDLFAGEKGVKVSLSQDSVLLHATQKQQDRFADAVEMLDRYQETNENKRRDFLYRLPVDNQRDLRLVLNSMVRYYHHHDKGQGYASEQYSEVADRYLGGSSSATESDFAPDGAEELSTDEATENGVESALESFDELPGEIGPSGETETESSEATAAESEDQFEKTESESTDLTSDESEGSEQTDDSLIR